ncbi:MAG: hypothetical protein J6W29_10335, partial [Neisseriaceae bacterium]|nr:hypothetical protein [Neisseriaceae bacterium]
MNTQLTDNEALELKALIALSDEKLAKIENLEEVKKYLLNLKELDLCERDDITTLPNSISKLTQLTRLDLIGCENLTTIPENIGELSQLEYLHLDWYEQNLS